ncbi:hypothetical protein [Dactylosporangium sp. CA-139066]|uniref:hypothetical protein n=1 Tax=Dactylosporangium sp. CA-139066 TaxID=3239930 RepID=UPI003D8C4310
MTRAYPITPQPDAGPRFTYGLLLAVGRVLAEHGFPEVTDGGDLVALQQALYDFVYQPSTGNETTSCTS